MNDDLIPVGSPAPGFELKASDGHTYRLGEILRANHALLVFYPGNNTPG